MNSANIIYTQKFYLNKKNTKKNKKLNAQQKIKHIDNIMNELKEPYYSNNSNVILIDLSLILK